MITIHELQAQFVESFPSQMAPGVLYVSIAYKTTGHLCCCGCGTEVIAPLSPAQWVLTYDGDTVSLSPSIGNWTLECQSHYVIRRGSVLPARRFTSDEIADHRDRDRHALEDYYRIPSEDPAATAEGAQKRVASSSVHEPDAGGGRVRRWWSRRFGRRSHQ